MPHVLPGEYIPAQHVNLKLGPGLLQQSTVNESPCVISTRAGDLQHTTNRSKWWIDSNSRRVSILQRSFLMRIQVVTEHKVVYTSTSRVCCWGNCS